MSASDETMAVGWMRADSEMAMTTPVPGDTRRTCYLYGKAAARCQVSFARTLPATPSLPGFADEAAVLPLSSARTVASFQANRSLTDRQHAQPGESRRPMESAGPPM